MDLTEAQRDAMLGLGSTASGHDFVPEDVLATLLSLKLVYWRSPRDVDFTPAGEEVYKDLAGGIG